jgi:hypothetical protein
MRILRERVTNRSSKYFIYFFEEPFIYLFKQINFGHFKINMKKIIQQYKNKNRNKIKYNNKDYVKGL